MSDFAVIFLNLALVYLAMVGLLVFCVISLSNSAETKKMGFDERQLLARGRAYKYAFFSVIIYVSVSGLCDAVVGHMWCNESTNALVVLALGLLVFCAVCIWNDADLEVGENEKKKYRIFAVITAFDLVVGIGQLFDQGFQIENHQITKLPMNLVLGIAMCLICIVRLIKGVNYKE